MNNHLTYRVVLATTLGGVAMWVTAGVWHNLILPRTVAGAEAHHEGLLVGLIAYFTLALLMVYLYATRRKRRPVVVEGLILGMVTGILWVFPHGLTLAGIHGTSIAYEVRNALYHVVEQGIGGVVVAVIIGKGRRDAFKSI